MKNTTMCRIFHVCVMEVHFGVWHVGEGRGMFWCMREAIVPTEHKKRAFYGAFSCLAGGGMIVLVARVRKLVKGNVIK